MLQYQNTMLRNGHESTALGAYQFIHDTLGAAVRETGMPLDAKFDQATQDNLGYHLLQKRGWNDYKSGKLDKDTFMDNLASEWASLPLKSGKSKYAGVGSNAALIGARQDSCGDRPGRLHHRRWHRATPSRALSTLPRSRASEDNPLVEI